MSAFGLELDSIRFGRQARLGERGDSGLTASRLTPHSARSTSCDLAAQGSSRCSSGNLIAARQANLAARLRLGGYRNEATLDKMRLKHKTRLCRFITSPRRLGALRLSRRHLDFHPSFWGQTPCRVGSGPKKCVRNDSLFRYFSRLSLKWYKMRIQCGTFSTLSCFA